MRCPPVTALVCLAIVGVAQGQDKSVEPRGRLGDLLVELTGVSTPNPLLEGQGKFQAAPDRYWVVAEFSFRNAGTRVVCASLTGSLSAEYGLVARTGLGNGVTISELLPGQEEKHHFIFDLKRGADPLEVTVEILTYGNQCGDDLPRAAARSVRFPVRGVTSPKYDPSGASAPVNGGASGGGVYSLGDAVTPPTVLSRVEAKYSDEARKAKYTGRVTLSIVVSVDGKAEQIRVIKSLGMGLDEKAVEAIQQWRFKPGTKNGTPVAVQANITFDFSMPPKK